MESLFSKLSYAVEGAPLIALGASLLWGILSIILSPCHLASIPLIVGFIDEQGRISTKRAFSISLLFGIGILATIGAIGAITALLGRMIGDIGRWGNYFVAVIFFLVGLHLMGIIPMPWRGADASGYKRKGLLAALILGLLFGVALGPCTFAFMAPMLAVSFRASSSDLPYGISLLLAYGIGHCSVLVLAGTFTEVIQHYLNWTEKSKGTAIVRIICGILVIMGGIYMVLNAR
jgi:cytochrome c-type biogenesis protein